MQGAGATGGAGGTLSPRPNRSLNGSHGSLKDSSVLGATKEELNQLSGILPAELNSPPPRGANPVSLRSIARAFSAPIDQNLADYGADHRHDMANIPKSLAFSFSGTSTPRAATYKAQVIRQISNATLARLDYYANPNTADQFGKIIVPCVINGQQEHLILQEITGENEADNKVEISIDGSLVAPLPIKNIKTFTELHEKLKKEFEHFCGSSLPISSDARLFDRLRVLAQQGNSSNSSSSDGPLTKKLTRDSTQSTPSRRSPDRSSDDSTESTPRSSAIYVINRGNKHLDGSFSVPMRRKSSSSEISDDSAGSGASTPTGRTPRSPGSEAPAYTATAPLRRRSSGSGSGSGSGSDATSEPGTPTSETPRGRTPGTNSADDKTIRGIKFSSRLPLSSSRPASAREGTQPPQSQTTTHHVEPKIPEEDQ